MRLKTFNCVLCNLLLFTAILQFGVYSQSQTCSSSDREVYDGRIQQVKGKVTLLNHPTLGKTSASGQYLVFQREDCKKCLIATHADSNGDYKIFVGVGRYKLIVQNITCDYAGVSGCDCSEFLAADQPRYIEVEKGRPYTEEFNINLVLQKK